MHWTTLVSAQDLAARLGEPGLVLVDCRHALSDADAGEAAQRIEQALGLESPLPGVFGPGQRLPAGHWRHYRESLAEEFALLAPVAARLGYPAE